MSKIRKLKVERTITRLTQIANDSTMENADFSGLSMTVDMLPQTIKQADGFIKRSTRLWRDSWITDPLNKIIEELKNEITR